MLPLVIASAAVLCLAGGAYARANADQALAIAVDGPGQVNGNGIACRDGSGDCVELYADGTSVTLTAVPDSGATFTGWGGDCTAAATNAACTMTMGSARAVTATFTSGGGGGAEADPDGQPGRQRQGDRQRDQLRRRQHRLLRVVQPRHRGHAHRDAQHGRDVLRLGRRVQRHLDHLHRDDEHVAERDRVLQQSHGHGPGEPRRHRQRARHRPGSQLRQGNLDCDELYATNTTVTLTAVPASGASFVGWGGACHGTGRTCTLSMTAPMAVSASFSPGPRAGSTFAVHSNGAPLVARTSVGWAVTLRFFTSRSAGALLRLSLNGRAMQAFTFSPRAGNVLVGPFNVARSGKYRFRMTLSDGRGGAAGLTWNLQVRSRHI